MTRRLVPEKLLEEYYDYDDYVLAVAPRDIPCSREYEEEFFTRRSPFKVNEIVAVAQNLRDMGYDPRSTPGGAIWGLDHTPAWTNKMFVSSGQCIHQVRIKDVRVERMQDITDEDCLKEGVRPVGSEYTVGNYMIGVGRGFMRTSLFKTPREAFAALVEKVSEKGSWRDNPYVFVYEFELVK